MPLELKKNVFLRLKLWQKSKFSSDFITKLIYFNKKKSKF